MKAMVSLVLAAALLCAVPPVSNAEPRQVMQGTQVHLTLLSSISTAVAKDGDPFVAVVSEPVYLGSQMILPAGTRVNGYIGVVGKAKRFSVIRGQAYLSLTFRSLEIDSRLIPVQMSIIAFQRPSTDGEGRKRRDLKVDEEGAVVEAKHDYKGDIIGGTIGMGGGTLIGAVFSNAARGFGLGLAGSAAYIVARKGKEVELPAQTGMLVRLESTVTVPSNMATSASSSSGR
jgi:hypothetical protein